MKITRRERIYPFTQAETISKTPGARRLPLFLDPTLIEVLGNFGLVLEFQIKLDLLSK